MTKTELVEEVYQAFNCTIPRWKIKRILNSAIATIIDEVAKGETVTIAGFGRFSSRPRAGRLWRNLRTGDPLQLPSYTLPIFKAAHNFKEAVRGKTDND